MKHPHNGPTFSKAPQKKRHVMTDAELAASQRRKDAELEETKRVAADSRRFHQLMNRDGVRRQAAHGGKRRGGGTGSQRRRSARNR
jgi:hypothetical protein